MNPSRARHVESYGFTCGEGEEWAVDYGEPSCATRPLSCSATVAEIEACLRDFVLPDHLCGPPPKTCGERGELLACLPGIRKTSSRRASLHSSLQPTW